MSWNNADSFLKKSWEYYLSITPSALKVINLLKSEGEEVMNDHIAYRTFNLSPFNLKTLASFFEKWGWEIKGQYQFSKKKLRALHLEKKNSPKIFMSELLCEEFSDQAQLIMKGLIQQVSNHSMGDMLSFERKWDLPYEDYLTLREESEYASWVAANGIIANHFTIYLNSLTKFKRLEQLNQFLKSKDLDFNQSGGEIEGSEKCLLRQSSLISDKRALLFEGRKETVSGCYMEFAERYKTDEGQYFQGFVTNSADRIFESTSL
jgi:hypothetical protein